MVRSVAGLDIVVARTEAEALLTEGRLIKEFKPRYNISFRDDKRFLLIRVDLSQPYPVLSLCRIRRDDGALYFGPYASSGSAREAVDFSEKTFGLRKCTSRVPAVGDHRHCMNDIIRFCSAPCIGGIDKARYRIRLDEACAFLRGERSEYLKPLRAEMKAAAEALEFERAGALRDTLRLLEAAIRRGVRIGGVPDLRRLERERGLKELGDVLGLTAVPATIEGYDISNILGTSATASMVCFVNGAPHKSRYRRFRIRTVKGANDPAMMAEAMNRRFGGDLANLLPPPDLVVVDGGMAQLSAVRAELDRLGLQDLRVAGLAKQFEEIYHRVGAPPLRLPDSAPALRILQHLRDEAHRFAVDYHHRLRSRLFKESALDDVPGVGERRKQRLLEHFGSVYRLRRASEEEIARVGGIGVELARSIKTNLGSE
jgi:excinuclease ABC subunit C